MVGPLAFLAPLFVQVALTFILLLWGGLLRVRSIRTGEAVFRDIALREPNWPRQAMQVMNAYENQLELPVLFYLAVVLALVTGHPTLGMALLAWLFVAARLLHALVHVTTNNVPRRFFVFLAGFATLVLMWLLLTFELVAGSA